MAGSSALQPWKDSGTPRILLEVARRMSAGPIAEVSDLASSIGIGRLKARLSQGMSARSHIERRRMKPRGVANGAGTEESPRSRHNPSHVPSVPYPLPMLHRVLARAPAKLNLALSVGAPDASGMHPICSWMMTVDLFDELDLVRLPGDRLSRYAILWHDEARRRTEIDWPVSKDLSVRAHLALEAKVGRSLPVQMRLDKRIPVGGGLGGGSSDAAAMLHAVNLLYQLGLTTAELARVGRTLGSDVPFLVHGGSAIVEGLGESIESQPLAPLSAVLILPRFGCPTGGVYKAYDAAGPVPLRTADVRSMALAAGRLPRCFNDLAQPAARVAPELAPLMDSITQLAERPAHLSGSGSTLFVLCDDPLHAEYLSQAIERTHDLPALVVAPTPGVETRLPSMGTIHEDE